MSRCRCDWFEGAEQLLPNSRLTYAEEERIREEFQTWIIRERIAKNTYRARCSRCGAVFGGWRRTKIEKELSMLDDIYSGDYDSIFETKHGGTLVCPDCGAPAELADVGKVGHVAAKMFERHRFAVFREQSGWLTIQLLYMRRDFAGHNWKAEPEAESDETVYAFRPGCVLMWESYLERKGEHWEKKWKRRTNVTEGGHWYIPVGEGVIDKSELRYSAWNQIDFIASPYAAVDEKAGLIRYLAEYCHRPALEMITKIGMFDVVQNLVYRNQACSQCINWKGKNLPQVLRLPKADQKRFCKSKMKSLEFLRELQESRKADGKIDWQVVEVMHKYGTHVVGRLKDHLHGRQMSKVLQKLNNRGLDVHMAMIWLDYIDMAENLDYDLENDEVYFPKDVQEQHDIVMANTKVKKNAKKIAMYRKGEDRLKSKIELQREGLSIILPHAIEDIVNEGTQQCNCVARYAERHFSGETMILFLRKTDEPEKSLVTIEADAREPWTLHQVYGHHNDGGKKPEEKAAVVYADWLNVWKAWMQAGSPRDEEGNPIIVNTVEALA